MDMLLKFIGAIGIGLLYVLAEGTLEFGFAWVFEVLDRRISRRFRPAGKPFYSALKYFGYGLVAGIVSIWAVPMAMTPWPFMRWLNLVILPAMVGFSMALVGKRRVRKGKEVFKMHSFAYGAAFGFGLTLVRLLLAKV